MTKQSSGDPLPYNPGVGGVGPSAAAALQPPGRPDSRNSNALGKLRVTYDKSCLETLTCFYRPASVNFPLVVHGAAPSISANAAFLSTFSFAREFRLAPILVSSALSVPVHNLSPSFYSRFNLRFCCVPCRSEISISLNASKRRAAGKPKLHRVVTDRPAPGTIVCSDPSRPPGPADSPSDSQTNNQKQGCAPCRSRCRCFGQRVGVQAMQLGVTWLPWRPVSGISHGITRDRDICLPYLPIPYCGIVI